MSQKNVVNFLAYLKQNPDFVKKLESAESPEERGKLMEKKGFAFTIKEMLEARNALIKKHPDDFISGKLSDEELDAAVGGSCIGGECFSSCEIYLC